MKVVVTGGAGFIGSHLADALLAAGHVVHVVDNLSTGRLSNLAHHQGESRLVVHQLDIAADDLKEALEGASHVYHLAALADIVPSIERPLEYARANVEGTFKVLEAARHAGVRRVVYAASSSCYGVPDRYPTAEDAPCAPRYPYALTKLLGEEAVLHWGEAYGLSTVCLRLFNVYGRRSRTNGTYGAMFGVFLAQRLAGKPLTVVGDGTQSRDFTHVRDVARAFVQAGASELRGAYNVGTGRPTTVNRIVELLASDVVHLPKRPGEPDRTHADVRKIEQALAWSAEIDIETGVAELLEHIDEWREAPVWTPDSIAVSTQSWFKNLGRRPDGATQ